MTGSLVSIIIPCYNAGRWVAETLESAMAQTWPEKEIIVVNDGSLDNSLAVAQKYAARGVQIINQSHCGAAAARNTGLHAARGAYIQFLDADDVLDARKISTQMARAELSKPRRLLSGRWARFTGSMATAKFRDNPLCADLSPREFMLLYCNQDCMMHPAAWLIPRALIDVAGEWDERLSLNDDGEFFARLVMASDGTDYSADALSFYRSGLSGSLSGNKTRRKLESAFLAAKLITDRLLHYENSSATRTAAANLWQRFAYDYYPASPDLVKKAEDTAKGLASTTFLPQGGRRFEIARRIIGWKLARRLQSGLGKIRYKVIP